MARRKHIAKQRKVSDTITAHYGKYRVADTIMNMRVDTRRKQISETEINRVYERFQMTRYKNKAEFTKEMSSHFPYSQEEIDTLWREYEHRDDLVRTGQYEEARLENYRKNYIDTLRSRNVPEEIINRIQNLSLNEWSDLIQQPNADKGKEKDRVLPVLGGGFLTTKPGANDNDKLEEFIEELEEAFNEAGLSLDIADTIQSIIDETEQDDVNIARRFIRSREDRNMVYDEGSEAEEIISIGKIVADRYKDEGRSYQISKSGYKYIRGIGSTRPGSKNRALALAIIYHLDED